MELRRSHTAERGRTDPHGAPVIVGVDETGFGTLVFVKRRVMPMHDHMVIVGLTGVMDVLRRQEREANEASAQKGCEHQSSGPT
jgi:hypothetical protein